VHRHVGRHEAALVAVHPHFHLFFHRQGEETARGVERVLNDAFVHAVVDDEEEADLGAGPMDFPSNLVNGAGYGGQVRPDIDDRDSTGGGGHDGFADFGLNAHRLSFPIGL
jgi:hypothetical protein